MTEASVERDKPESETQFAVVMTSLLLGLAGCYGITLTAIQMSNIMICGEFIFGLGLIIQAALTVLFELGVISFNIWGWVK